MMKCFTGDSGPLRITKDLEGGGWTMYTPHTELEEVKADIALAESATANFEGTYENKAHL